MKRLSRSTDLKTAALMNFLLGIFGLFSSILFLAQGAEALNQSGNTAPYFVFILGAFLAPIHIIGAYGAWRNQRWGIVLLILASAVALISVAPGVVVASTPFLRLLASAGILIDMLVIVLCLWRDRKPTGV